MGCCETFCQNLVWKRRQGNGQHSGLIRTQTVHDQEQTESQQGSEGSEDSSRTPSDQQGRSNAVGEAMTTPMAQQAEGHQQRRAGGLEDDTGQRGVGDAEGAVYNLSNASNPGSMGSAQLQYHAQGEISTTMRQTEMTRSASQILPETELDDTSQDQQHRAAETEDREVGSPMAQAVQVEDFSQEQDHAQEETQAAEDASPTAWGPGAGESSQQTGEYVSEEAGSSRHRLPNWTDPSLTPSAERVQSSEEISDTERKAHSVIREVEEDCLTEILKGGNVGSEEGALWASYWRSAGDGELIGDTSSGREDGKMAQSGSETTDNPRLGCPPGLNANSQQEPDGSRTPRASQAEQEEDATEPEDVGPFIDLAARLESTRYGWKSPRPAWPPSNSWTVADAITKLQATSSTIKRKTPWIRTLFHDLQGTDPWGLDGRLSQLITNALVTCDEVMIPCLQSFAVFECDREDIHEIVLGFEIWALDLMRKLHGMEQERISSPDRNHVMEVQQNLKDWVMQIYNLGIHIGRKMLALSRHLEGRPKVPGLDTVSERSSEQQSLSTQRSVGN